MMGDTVSVSSNGASSIRLFYLLVKHSAIASNDGHIYILVNCSSYIQHCSINPPKCYISRTWLFHHLCRTQQLQPHSILLRLGHNYWISTAVTVPLGRFNVSHGANRSLVLLMGGFALDRPDFAWEQKSSRVGACYIRLVKRNPICRFMFPKSGEPQKLLGVHGLRKDWGKNWGCSWGETTFLLKSFVE